MHLDSVLLLHHKQFEVGWHDIGVISEMMEITHKIVKFELLT